MNSSKLYYNYILPLVNDDGYFYINDSKYMFVDDNDQRIRLDLKDLHEYTQENNHVRIKPENIDSKKLTFDTEYTEEQVQSAIDNYENKYWNAFYIFTLTKIREEKINNFLYES